VPQFSLIYLLFFYSYVLIFIEYGVRLAAIVINIILVINLRSLFTCLLENIFCMLAYSVMYKRLFV